MNGLFATQRFALLLNVGKIFYASVPPQWIHQAIASSKRLVHKSKPAKHGAVLVKNPGAISRYRILVTQFTPNVIATCECGLLVRTCIQRAMIKVSF